MASQINIRHVGDTEVAIAATLQRPDDTAVNLTSCTVRFKMISAATGADKVAETNDNVSVTDAANGQCQYDPQAVDVNTAGLFYAYFTVEDASGNKDTFPVRERDLRILFERDA